MKERITNNLKKKNQLHVSLNILSCEYVFSVTLIQNECDKIHET